MARLPRLYAPGCAHHIIQRGNNRVACFLQKTDRKRYLSILLDVSAKYAVAIHAYVLMTNHVHLLVTPQNANSCGQMMQSLGRSYVRYFNDQYLRSGTLWEGRYKSTLVDTDAYFFTVARYIELNPVRAGMVAHPREHPWSSYASNAEGLVDPLLTQHSLYIALGTEASERQRRYQKFFEDDVDAEVENELREATNKGWAFGSDDFKSRLERSSNRPARSAGWGGARKAKRRAGFQGI